MGIYGNFLDVANPNFLTQKVPDFCKKMRNQGLFNGAAGQIRTADLILTKDALYRLSYSSILAPDWGQAVMATEKGLEPSTSSVTGWRSNLLNYSATGALIR